ncbi:hypothetical protein MTO96_032575, partial [Rhipicephalus appendiculatus]
MAATPLVIIGKVIHDSASASPPLRPLSDFNVTQNIFRTHFDLTNEENIWSALAGALPYSFVRLGFDQMAVQRYIAARTLRQAKRMAVTGAAIVITFFVVAAFGALAIIYWYRDCDLALSGAISSYDQVWHAVGRGLSAIPPPPVIPGTMDRCPLMTNATDAHDPVEQSVGGSLPYVFPLYWLSFYWMALAAELLTIILGTVISLLT